MTIFHESDPVDAVTRGAYKAEDGYYRLKFTLTDVTSDDLRAMAKALDEMNAEWDENVKAATE